MATAPRVVQSWADAVLLPGFHGPVAPDWLRRRMSAGLGGVCLFASNIVEADQVRALTDSLRIERADVVIAVDEEGGAVTRLDAATGSRFPGAAALGHVDDVRLTERVGAGVGRLVAAAGITLNFAPCADVMLDPMNPVIGTRSFGSDPRLVARHTAAFVRGHQGAGVAACAKHFPGHGNTEVDTHLSVAVIDADAESMRRSALPFAAAIDAGVASIMAGHLLAPAMDSLPASVSRRWLTEILRDEMAFTGVVVSDALEMAAIAGPYGLVEGSVMAVASGADLLCLGADDGGPDLLDAIVAAVMAAVRSGRIREERLFDAAGRVASLSRGPMAVAPDDLATDGVLGADAAARAVCTAGPVPVVAPGLLVIRCEAGRNFAIGDVPWGPMTALPKDLLASELILTRDDAVPVHRLQAPPQVLVVTSDRHRYEWMRAVVARVRSVRPDAVLIEMGTAGISDDDAPALASFGAGMANARAVVDRLRG